MTIKTNRKISLFCCSLVVGILGVCHSVLAVQWVAVGDLDGKHYYVDADSYKTVEKGRIFWGRAKNSTGKIEWSAKFSVQCDQKKAAILEQIQYATDGMIKNRYILNSEQDKNLDYETIIPGTAANLYYRFVCKNATQKPKDAKPTVNPSPTKKSVTPTSKPSSKPSPIPTSKSSPKPSPTPTSKPTPSPAATSKPSPLPSQSIAPESNPSPSASQSETPTNKPETIGNKSEVTANIPDTNNPKSEVISSPTPKPSENEINSYPKAACGDTKPAPELYGVFSDYTPQRLRYIQTQLCRDAFLLKRKDGKEVIQVASFGDKKDAIKFATFLLEKVGSAEVASP